MEWGRLEGEVSVGGGGGRAWWPPANHLQCNLHSCGWISDAGVLDKGIWLPAELHDIPTCSHALTHETEASEMDQHEIQTALETLSTRCHTALSPALVPHLPEVPSVSMAFTRPKGSSCNADPGQVPTWLFAQPRLPVWVTRGGETDSWSQRWTLGSTGTSEPQLWVVATYAWMHWCLHVKHLLGHSSHLASNQIKAIYICRDLKYTHISPMWQHMAAAWLMSKQKNLWLLRIDPWPVNPQWNNNMFKGL